MMVIIPRVLMVAEHIPNNVSNLRILLNVIKFSFPSLVRSIDQVRQFR